MPENKADKEIYVMKFSATVTLQYDTIFSPFSVTDYVKGLDWIKENGFDGAELCISNYQR